MFYMKRKFLLVLGAISAVMALALPASAQTFDPTTEVTTLVTAGAAALGPIIIAVFTGLLGVSAAYFGGRWVLRAIRNGGRA